MAIAVVAAGSFEHATIRREAEGQDEEVQDVPCAICGEPSTALCRKSINNCESTLCQECYEQTDGFCPGCNNDDTIARVLANEQGAGANGGAEVQMLLTAGTGDEVAISESGGQNPDKHKTDKTQTAEEVEEVVAVETALAIAATDEVVKAVVAKVAALEVDVVATKFTAALEVDVVATKVAAESEVLVTVRIGEERKDERKTTTNTSADNGIANADRRQQRFSNPTFVPKIVQQKKSQKQKNKTAVEEAQCEKAEQPMKADSVIIHSAMVADSKSADVQEDNIKSFAIEAPVVPDVAQVVARGDRCYPLKVDDDDDRRDDSENNNKNGKLNNKQGYCNNHNDDST
jgi:hypothetical protein